jgi:hypothetical protein
VQSDRRPSPPPAAAPALDASAPPRFPPPAPPASAGVRAEAAAPLRFEDVAHDGRLVLEALPNAIGPAVWGRLLAHDPLATACREKGIVPILGRLVLEGTVGPFAVGTAMKAETTYQIALVEDDRLVLDVWADLFAPTGRTHGAAPHTLEGERPQALEGEKLQALAGRVFAEHVFTKPFAPAGQRRVTRSDLEGVLPALAQRPPLPSPESMTTLPEGGVALEAGPRLDPWPITFGVVHTDSNRHVNSLVYLRVFEEAALRRFASLGVEKTGPVGLGRRIDIAYRKPCVPGQTVRVAAQAFRHERGVGVVATLVSHAEGGADEAIMQSRPYAYARLWLEA